MPLKEKIKIEESLVIHIKDKDGNVTVKIVKPFWSDLKWWEKILVRLGIKKYPGTLQSFGLEHAARLYGNVGSPLYINQIGAYFGSWTWKTSNNSYEATGILVVDNEGDEWTSGTNWTKVGCRNSGSGSTHNEITVEVDLSGASGITWWAEIKFKFT